MSTPSKKYGDGTKEAAALGDQLRDMPDEWVLCRDVMHAWTVIDDYHVVTTQRARPGMYIGRDLQCARCNTLRHDVYHVISSRRTQRLEKVSASYSYPAGYQMHGIPRGNKPQQVVRAEQYRRAMERAAQAVSNS